MYRKEKNELNKVSNLCKDDIRFFIKVHMINLFFIIKKQVRHSNNKLFKRIYKNNLYVRTLFLSLFSSSSS